MAWTTISNALVAVGAKPFATTIQALRDNPVAIAEGATGAPQVHPAALETFRGVVSITGTTEQTYLDLDRYVVIRADVHMVAANSATTTTFQVRYSNDNGSTWGSYQAITNLNPVNSSTASDRRDLVGMFRLNLSTGVGVGRGVVSGQGAASLAPSAAVIGTFTHTVPSGCNAIGLRFSVNVGNTAIVDLDGLSGSAL